MSTPQPRLSLHEWFIVAVIYGAIFLTIAVSLAVGMTPSPPAPFGQVEEHIVIEVRGAVEHPGFYQVEKGATRQELLEMAGPLPGANVTRPSLPINTPQTLTVSP